MAVRTTCCGCIEIAVGCKIWALIYSILSVGGIIGSSYSIAVASSLYPTSVPEGLKLKLSDLEYAWNWLIGIYTFALVYFMVELTINVLLIRFINQVNLMGCKVWIWFHVGILVFNAVMVYQRAKYIYPGNYKLAILYHELLYFVASLPTIYVISVVRRFVVLVEHKRMWEEEEKGEGNA